MLNYLDLKKNKLQSHKTSFFLLIFSIIEEIKTEPLIKVGCDTIVNFYIVTNHFDDTDGLCCFDESWSCSE